MPEDIEALKERREQKKKERRNSMCVCTYVCTSLQFNLMLGSLIPGLASLVHAV